jgi:hypothetical protein
MLICLSCCISATVPECPALSPRQFRQLGDIGLNPSRLILAEQLSCRTATGFALIIDRTMKQLGVTSTIQGGGKWRAGMNAG